MKKLAVIGVGNMAKAIIGGIMRSNLPDAPSIVLFDKNKEQYSDLNKYGFDFIYADSVLAAVSDSDLVLLSVKPQNYDEILSEIASIPTHAQKLYISIAAGIKVEDVSQKLNGAKVIRVLPNIPMVIGSGVCLVCKNDSIVSSDFDYVCSLFAASSSILRIEESEMNRMISVTSSSPAYVFRFINAIYEGAIAQGLDLEPSELIDSICDVVIGSAMLLKSSSDSPEELCSKVASKGGTTEQSLNKLSDMDFDNVILQAMLACTKRADELGEPSK